MALKTRSTRRPWKATWPGLVNYAGDNLVTKSDLLVSVNGSYGANHPFQSLHTTLDGSIGIAISNPAAGSKRFLEPFGPSSFGSVSLGKADSSARASEAEIWARTNPSRASVLLPVFLFELKEIPEMIRFAGRVLLNPPKWVPKDPARAHLALQFGWVPFVSDLVKISRLQKAIDKRRTEFDRLHKSGLKRRIGCGGGSDPPFQNSVFANFGNYRNFSVPVTHTYRWEAWAVVNWVLTNPSSLPPSDADIARRLTGLTVGHITENIWEALPWSWLVDWFTNVGAVIKAGNRADARPNGGVLMTKYTSVATHPPAASGSDILTAGKLTRLEHTRQVLGSPLVSASIPILGARQLSILGSLATVRLLK